MLAEMDVKIIAGLATTPFLAILGVVYWCARVKVNHKYCDTVQKANEKDHHLIRGWIQDAEERAKERHSELKTDLSEVKELIRNNRQV